MNMSRLIFQIGTLVIVWGGGALAATIAQPTPIRAYLVILFGAVVCLSALIYRRSQ